MPAKATQPQPQSKAESTPTGAPGSQTLARGLSALAAIAAAPTGLTVQQVADHVGAHRTIAYRLLATLSQ
ncbi:helix-turn-helix domain-containing protein, partial [Mycolicibacterium thermoresistibile]